MTWVLWRQHRGQALIVTVGLAVIGAALLITGVFMAHDYTSALHSCPPTSRTCELVGQLFRGDGAIIDTVHFSVVVPLLLGAFLGATLIASETERGTNVLAWTQTVTRRTWLYTQVAFVLIATVIWTAVLTALVTWWSGTPNALYGNRFEGAQFDTQNILPVAFALFAVGLGLAAGAVLRRTLPALAVTVGGYVAVRLAVAIYLRPHYMAPVTMSLGVGPQGQLPSGSWTISNNLVSPTGHAINGNLVLPSTCQATASRAAADGCLQRLGYHTVLKYQPASRYWHFQWAEALVFVALAVVLIAFALVHTIRHDA